MDALTDAQRADLNIKLVEAETAYHQTIIGGGIREIRDQNGEQLTYSSANRSSLLQYINYLRSMLGLGAFGGVVSRPMGVYL